MEGLILAACLSGSGEACSSGLNSYIKYNKLDQRAQIIEQNIKKKYKAAHFTGVVLATAANRKWNFVIYSNFWFQGDYNDLQNSQNMVVYKLSF